MCSSDLRRVPWVDRLSCKLQNSTLKKVLKEGERPFVWIQSGLDERVVEKLPYVDVFSVFDDPYLHSPKGILSKKASLVVVQNKFSRELFEKGPQKLLTLCPPVDMDPVNFSDDLEVEFPPDFPSTLVGYIGSFFSDGFNLVLFEEFIRSFPEWGFVLCGRTDIQGLKKIEALKNYKNF